MYVWLWFKHLDDTRQKSIQGASKITYSEMVSFFQLYALRAKPWEVELVKKLDAIALSVPAQKEKIPSTKPKIPKQRGKPK